MREYLPALSAEFGIKPADIDDMTVGEINEYFRALKELHTMRRKLADKIKSVSKGKR